MYSNNFIVTIKNNKGEVLRESCNKEVYLPFHSEYSIMLKNNNNRRASAEVWIDGTKILGENRIIIEPNESVDLDRFCIDGNLNSGRRLKFVPLSDGRVQDPSSSDNGIVKVRFWLEEEKNTHIYYYQYPEPYKPYCPPYPTCPPICPPWSSPDNTTRWRTLPEDILADTFTVNNSDICYQYNVRGTSNCCVQNMSFDGGATVEGGHSNQTFRETSIGKLESSFTEITLRLKPFKESITVKETKVKYCSNCGKKSKYGAKFCSDCGNRF
jgi:hypothetical protein